MKVDYIQHYSQSLGRDMEYKVYGEGRKTIIVFPSQDGRFYDFENFGMIDIMAPYIERGEARVVCVDGIDPETWSAQLGDPRKRICLHEKWFGYITSELIPELRRADEMMATMGCSMGGFHAANAFFRRPDLFDRLLALSGIYSSQLFFGNYMDDLVYANSPEHYLGGMPADHPYWDLYRQRRIICCVGQGRWEDELLASTRNLDTILAMHGVDRWIDYWGYDVDHDWPWWRRQLAYFLPPLLR